MFSIYECVSKRRCSSGYTYACHCLQKDVALVGCIRVYGKEQFVAGAREWREANLVGVLII